jgi:ribonuclease G
MVSRFRGTGIRQMAQEILINAGAAEIRIATLEDGRLQGLASETVLGDPLSRGKSRIGDILVGRVQKVVPAIQAAFVDVGMERAGFLGQREARALAPAGENAAEAPIETLVREGEAVVVQIVKDPIGEKGARLSAGIALPGRLLVMTPLQGGIALSRRIEDEAERARLAVLGKEILNEGDLLVPGAGFIFRTNAIGAAFDELCAEAQTLAETWRTVAAARSGAEPPELLFRDLGPVERALRDLVGKDVARIVIDDAGALAAARAYCRAAMPEMEARLFPFAGPGALFDTGDIESDIEALSRPRVALKGGGWITLEPTEALTAVDVNSGSFTDASGVEDTGLAVNLEAAREIGRQVRLRGIGGVIVIDFIHMADEEHAARVIAALKESLAGDGKPVEVAPLSPFGLVEVTRKRVREPREKRTGEICPSCCGSGRLRRASAVGLDVVRGIEAAARAAPGAAIAATAAPPVVQWLEAQGEILKEALAAKGAGRVEFTADAMLSREAFHVETRP